MQPCDWYWGCGSKGRENHFKSEFQTAIKVWYGHNFKSKWDDTTDHTETEALMRDFVQQWDRWLGAGIRSSRDALTHAELCRNRSRFVFRVLSCVARREPVKSLQSTHVNPYRSWVLQNKKNGDDTKPPTSACSYARTRTAPASIRVCIHVKQSRVSGTHFGLGQQTEMAWTVYSGWFFSDFWLIGNNHSTLSRCKWCFLECFAVIQEFLFFQRQTSYSICPPFQKGQTLH